MDLPGETFPTWLIGNVAMFSTKNAVLKFRENFRVVRSMINLEGTGFGISRRKNYAPALVHAVFSRYKSMDISNI